MLLMLDPLGSIHGAAETLRKVSTGDGSLPRLIFVTQRLSSSSLRFSAKRFANFSLSSRKLVKIYRLLAHDQRCTLVAGGYPYPEPNNRFKEAKREDQAILQIPSEAGTAQRRPGPGPEHAIFFEQVCISSEGEQKGEPDRHVRQPVFERCEFVERGGCEICNAEEGEDDRNES